MIHLLKHKNNLATILFFVLGVVFVFATYAMPVGDFGNYYYGSKIFLDNNFSIEDYKNIAHFNRQIAAYGETNFFENYIPVPPFSLLVYIPLTVLKCHQAKLLFNLLGLLVFCFSLLRLLNRLKINSWLIYGLPLVFGYSLFSNILQGQFYLFAAGFIIEAFIASEKGNSLVASIFLSIVICLKIFPVFILLFFLFKKQYKIVVYTFILSVFIYVITAFVTGCEITEYYFSTVLPRLLNNDIIGAYYYGNESIYTVLLNLFSYDAIHNPNPIINNHYLVIIFESICSSIILLTLFKFRTFNTILFYGLTLFCSVLISRYNTTYSMLLLIPFFVGLQTVPNKPKLNLAIFICLLLSLSMPIGYFINYPFWIRFLKLFIVLIIFVLIVINYSVKINYKLFIPLVVALLTFKYFTTTYTDNQYFQVQNTKGILFDYRLQNDSIIMCSTLGEREIEEKFAVIGKIETSNDLAIKDNILYYKNEVISDTKDSKVKPLLFNDSLIVFMSDLNQGIGCYKLRCEKLPK